MHDERYMVVVTRTVTTTGEPCYLAIHPELPGCMASARTDEEARQNLDDARELYISALERRGVTVPPPAGGWSTVGTATVAVTAQTPLATAEVVQSR